jgi:hypothetical protein
MPVDDRDDHELEPREPSQAERVTRTRLSEGVPQVPLRQPSLTGHRVESMHPAVGLRPLTSARAMTRSLLGLAGRTAWATRRRGAVDGAPHLRCAVDTRAAATAAATRQSRQAVLHPHDGRLTGDRVAARLGEPPGLRGRGRPPRRRVRRRGRATGWQPSARPSPPSSRSGAPRRRHVVSSPALSTSALARRGTPGAPATRVGRCPRAPGTRATARGYDVAGARPVPSGRPV